MDCAIICIQFLFQFYDFDITLLNHLNIYANGISIYDLVNISKDYGLYLKAYYSFFIPKDVPCILYYKNGNSGHYYVLLENNFLFCKIYDPVYKERKVFKLFIYFIYSHICIMILSKSKNVV